MCSGLPPVWARSRSTAAAGTGPPVDRAASSATAAVSSGPRSMRRCAGPTSRARPAGTRSRPSGRHVRHRTTWSPCTRRAAKVIASSDARSAQCTSSTTTTSGRSSARPSTKRRSAAPATRGSVPEGGTSVAGRRPSSGERRTSCSSTPYSRSDSAGSASATTPSAPEHARAWRTRDVLPIPASPTTSATDNVAGSTWVKAPRGPPPRRLARPGRRPGREGAASESFPCPADRAPDRVPTARWAASSLRDRRPSLA